mmetsp:Transcript_82429/g.163551  ORF Transcript_82429/g.163551 Transcript_82429/m.163551 type:complete len:386 (+) Transcript_82429:56-1213(+)
MPNEVQEQTETMAWLHDPRNSKGLKRAEEMAQANLAALKREHHIRTSTSSLGRIASAHREHSDMADFDSSASDEDGNPDRQGLCHTLEARVFESFAVMVRDAVRTASEETTVELRAMAAEIRSLRAAAFSPATAVGVNTSNSAATSLQELLEGLQRIMDDIRRKLLSMEATKATHWCANVTKSPAAEGRPVVPLLQKRPSGAAVPRINSPILSPGLRPLDLVTRLQRTLEGSAAESTASTATQAESNGVSPLPLSSQLSAILPARSREPSNSAAKGSAIVSSRGEASAQRWQLPLRTSSSHKTLAFPQCMDQHGSQSVQFLGTARSSHGSSGSSARGRPSGASAPAPPGDAAGRRLGGSLTPHSSGRMTWADRRGLTLAEQMAGD